jgi:hypothetical protein
MICSTSVVPERGMPRTKVGTAEASPPPDFSAINSRVKIASIRSNKANVARSSYEIVARLPALPASRCRNERSPWQRPRRAAWNSAAPSSPVAPLIAGQVLLWLDWRAGD